MDTEKIIQDLEKLNKHANQLWNIINLKCIQHNMILQEVKEIKCELKKQKTEIHNLWEAKKNKYKKH